MLLNSHRHQGSSMTPCDHIHSIKGHSSAEPTEEDMIGSFVWWAKGQRIHTKILFFLPGKESFSLLLKMRVSMRESRVNECMHQHIPSIYFNSKTRMFSAAITFYPTYKTRFSIQADLVIRVKSPEKPIFLIIKNNVILNFIY